MEQNEPVIYSEEMPNCWAIRLGEWYSRDDASEGQYECGEEENRFSEGVVSMTKGACVQEMADGIGHQRRVIGRRQCLIYSLGAVWGVYRGCVEIHENGKIDGMYGRAGGVWVYGGDWGIINRGGG